MTVNPVFYALNVGRGDALVLNIPSGRRSHIIVIDGGDAGVSSASLSNFLVTRRIKKVDLLILTHLHNDHLRGLLEIAGTIEIVEAVLPYPELPAGLVLIAETAANLAATSASSMALTLSAYHRLFKLLKEGGSVISLRYPFGPKQAWDIGPFALCHLSPASLGEMPGFAVLKEAYRAAPVEGSEDHRTGAVSLILSRFDSLANTDSSIWMLENRETQEQLLLCGEMRHCLYGAASFPGRN